MDILNKYKVLLGIIISLGVIGAAIYKFDICKVDKTVYASLVAGFDVHKLQDHRRLLQERIWAIKNKNPNTYRGIREYQELIEELRKIDLQINAYYQKKKG